MPVCSECCEESSDGFSEIPSPYQFTVQIYELRKKSLISGSHEIDPTQLQLCENCFRRVEIGVLGAKEARKVFKPRKNDNDNTTSACSTCLQESDAFLEIISPELFTKEIPELRKKGLLFGTHYIDPRQLQLCETCFDIVDDKFTEECDKRSLQRRANRLLSNASAAVKTEPQNSEAHGIGSIDKVWSCSDGSEVENVSAAKNIVGPGGPSSQGESIEPTATKKSAKDAKRRKTTTKTTSGSLNDDDDGEDNLLPRKPPRRGRRRRVTKTKEVAEESDESDSFAPDANEDPNDTSNGVDDFDLLEDDRDSNRNAGVYRSDEEQARGSGDNSSSTGTVSVADKGVYKAIQHFIRHAYDLDQGQSSKTNKKENINKMFEYYNGHIETETGYRYPRSPVSTSTTTWIENEGPKTGYPHPKTLLRLNPKSAQSGSSNGGWNSDQILTAMKLDLTQEKFSNPKPALVVVFLTEQLYEYLKHKQKHGKGSEKKAEMLFNIPENVSVFFTASLAVVAQLDNLEEAKEMENCDLPLASGLVIPEIEGMKIKTFEFTEEVNRNYGKGEGVHAKNCGEILNILPSEKDNVVAIIVFFTEDYADEEKPIGALMSALFHFISEKPKVAVAGGLHYKNIYFDGATKQERKPVAMGIVIMGDPSRVKAAAVNISGPANVKTKEQMQKIHQGEKPVGIPSDSLRELKNMKKYFESESGGSFAFQISCAERGFRMHKELHKEASLFKSIFPDTPLVGSFHNGDLVHEYKPWKRRGQQFKKPKNPEDLEARYTTTLLIIGHP